MKIQHNPTAKHNALSFSKMDKKAGGQRNGIWLRIGRKYRPSTLLSPVLAKNEENKSLVCVFSLKINQNKTQHQSRK